MVTRAGALAVARTAALRAGEFGFIITFAIGAFSLLPANAQEQTSSLRTTYGDVGIFEMPSARMAPDGELSVTVGALEGQQRYNLGFQILPWMEGSFRYSSITGFGRSGKTYYDRSFGLKMRLFQETRYTPDISLGMRDIIGTGIYGAEYIVATKRIWDVDLTGGLGWGRLADNATFPNPLGALISSFDVRRRTASTGGQVDFGQIFHGPNMGAFGGFVWHTPIDNLDVVAEYSSDHYTREASPPRRLFQPRNPFNYGLSYRLFDFMQLTAGYMYGTSWGAVLSMSADPTTDGFPTRLGEAPTPVATRTPDERTQAVASFVDDRTTRFTVASGTGPWTRIPRTPSDPAAKLETALAAGMRRNGDFEIDGSNLLIDIRLQHQDARAVCHTYAALAANSGLGVDTVALTDPDDRSGQVTTCGVPDGPPPPVVRASARQSDDTAANVQQSDADDNPAPATPPAPLPAISPSEAREAEQKIRADSAKQDLGVEAVAVGPHEALVYMDNETYYFETEAIGRIVRILMADTPPNIELFRIVSVVGGVPMRQTSIERAPLERMYLAYGHTTEVAQAINITAAPMDNPVLDAQAGGTYPRFSWAVFPTLREGFFDPNKPIEFELAGVATGGVAIMPGLSLDAEGDGSIWNDFNLSRRSNSKLPHVRSDYNLYFRHGKNGVGTLSLDYVTAVAPDIYVMARAGILEDMFAGAGAQVLWRPENSRWAVGADAYEVWQRGFDRLFDFRKYHVFTGHLTVYYQSPWHDLNFAVHAGRYLAGDYGATFEVNREFSSGVQVGAFATFTNVPFRKFGEGSFDKGIYIHIPLEWILPFFTQSSYDLPLRPLQRDGGQRLAGDDALYGITSSTSENEIAGHIDDIAYPPQ